MCKKILQFFDFGKKTALQQRKKHTLRQAFKTAPPRRIGEQPPVHIQSGSALKLSLRYTRFGSEQLQGAPIEKPRKVSDDDS